MKLILALVVSVLTACGGGSNTPEAAAVTTTATTATATAASTTTTPSTTPSTTPDPSLTPATANPLEPSATTLTPGAVAWGKNQCAGCHGGNTSKGLSAALTMSSMQTVQKHKDAYGPTAISGWNITVSQSDADLIAVFAQSCLGTPQPRECR
jgi:mono/diheme cytochrome c family protein